MFQVKNEKHSLLVKLVNVTFDTSHHKVPGLPTLVFIVDLKFDWMMKKKNDNLKRTDITFTAEYFIWQKYFNWQVRYNDK